MKALSQDEILKVLKAASDSARDLAMILIAFRHGMRASEVCGLEVKDVDIKNGEITIRRLKGSLKTTQPLADLQGQPLLSEKRVLRAWLTERGDHPKQVRFRVPEERQSASVTVLSNLRERSRASRIAER